MKKTFRYMMSLLAAAVIISALSLGAFGAEACEHAFVGGKCSLCGGYYVVAGKSTEIVIETEGSSLGIAWTTSSENEIIEVEKYDNPLFSERTKVTVKGLKVGESTAFAYKDGKKFMEITLIVNCEEHLVNKYEPNGDNICVDGTKSGSCVYCGVKVTVSDVGSAAHMYKNFVSNNDASCTVDGTRTGTCVRCGKTIISLDIGSAKGHNYGTYTYNNNATCTENGTETAICKACDNRDTRVKSETALGHNYGDWVTEKEVTCTEDGFRKNSCKRCDNVIEETLKAKGHSMTILSAAEPTCTKPGESLGSSCKVCGEVFVGQVVIPALGHDYYDSLTKATLTENGRNIKSCYRCYEFFGGIETIYRPKKIAFSSTNLTYTGKVNLPELIVKDVKNKNLIKDTDYTFKLLTDCKSIGTHKVKIVFKGRYEGEKTLTYNIVPAKVKNLKATQTVDTVTLTWDKVPGATGYRVYTYDKKSGKFKTYKNQSGTSIKFKNLKAGTTYKYAVKAYTKKGETTFWAPAYEDITTSTKPKAPVVTLSTKNKSVTLKWNKVTGAGSYQIYMKAPGGEFKRIDTTEKNSYTKKKLKKGKTYQFRVRAVKKVQGKTIYGAYKTYKVTVK